MSFAFSFESCLLPAAARRVVLAILIKNTSPPEAAMAIFMQSALPTA